MELSALAGNRRLKAQLSQQEGGRGLSHAYIISGPVGSGRHTLGGLLAQAMVCTAPEHQRPCGHCPQCRKAQGGIHPDIAWIAGAGEGKPINVDQVRALRSDAYIRPNEGERKVYIFPDCALLTDQDQNVLLKIVEEGPPYAAFIFCADSPAALLETIRSRCVMLKYDDGAEAPLRPDAVELCRAFAAGRLLPVTAFLVGLDAKKPVPKREEVSAMLRDCWRTAAEALLLRRGKPRPEPSCAEEARRLADRLTDRQLTGLESVLRQYAGECDYNVGVGHVLGGLAAKWEELL